MMDIERASRVDGKEKPEEVPGEVISNNTTRGEGDAGIIKQTVSDDKSLDATEVFLQRHNYTPEQVDELLADDPRQRRLVSKIDSIVLPLLAFTYVLQYVDKQAMTYAAVFDLFTTTTVDESQYSWFASIFYFAYLVAEYPWVYLAQRTRMAKVVSGCVLSWGSVLMLTAACNDFSGLAACRFWLGWFEAPVTTCFMMMISQW